MNAEGLRGLAPSRDDPTLQRLPRRAAIYCVGGAVRDVLLGEAALDRDYLVTGVTPQEMAEAGFRAVGRDFPVFLHPVSHSEYALARTERKSGQGYKGFVFYTGPEVGLEEDLQRRDLRINAMAVDSDGVLHDPMQGQEDIHLKTLRHVSPAFREDPLRLLRLARFGARWPAFSVAPETLQLCAEIVASGELGALVAERVWAEVEKGLLATAPGRMMAILDDLAAWPSLVGSSERPTPGPVSLATAHALGLPGPALAGVLMNERPPGRLAAVLPRAVQEWRQLIAAGLASPAWAGLWSIPTATAQQASGLAQAVLDWAERADLFRHPDRTGPLTQLALSQANALAALEQVQSVLEGLVQCSVGDAARQAARSGEPIALAVQRHRLSWLSQALANREH